MNKTICALNIYLLSFLILLSSIVGLNSRYIETDTEAAEISEPQVKDPTNLSHLLSGFKFKSDINYFVIYKIYKESTLENFAPSVLLLDSHYIALPPPLSFRCIS